MQANHFDHCANHLKVESERGMIHFVAGSNIRKGEEVSNVPLIGNMFMKRDSRGGSGAHGHSVTVHLQAVLIFFPWLPRSGVQFLQVPIA